MAWIEEGSIQGPVGPEGPRGETGPAGPAGSGPADVWQYDPVETITLTMNVTGSWSAAEATLTRVGGTVVLSFTGLINSSSTWGNVLSSGTIPEHLRPGVNTWSVMWSDGANDGARLRANANGGAYGDGLVIGKSYNGTVVYVLPSGAPTPLMKGDPGEQGPPGEQGIQGERGPEGPVGPAPDTSQFVTQTETSASATANSLARRTANGQLTVSSPTAATHAATKSYVDSNASSGMSAAERAQLYGSSAYTAPPYGSLIWSGPTYSPAAKTFTRLQYSNDGRMRVNRSINAAAIAWSNTECYLIAPVDGMYLLSVVQCWQSDTSPRGAGLTTSISSAIDGLKLWQDIGLGRFVMTSTTTFLTAGTRLYPWVWNGATGSNMTASERGCQSEYSIQYVGPGTY